MSKKEQKTAYAHIYPYGTVVNETVKLADMQNAVDMAIHDE
jgi:hypothetical protein